MTVEIERLGKQTGTHFNFKSISLSLSHNLYDELIGLAQILAHP